MAVGVTFAGGLSLTGCADHHRPRRVERIERVEPVDPPIERVVIVDERGYRHEGYYDERRGWHGGWYDERHAFHEDAREWRREARR